MPPVPLPDVPCVRVRLDYTDAGSLKSGSRFYLSYSGSAPTGANCTTLASDVAAAWATDIAPLVGINTALTEVDVLDIATNSGLSGQWTGTNTGSRSGSQVANQIAMNVEFGIARRYRGGKPRMYLPAGVDSDFLGGSNWQSAFITSTNSAVASFFAALEALSIGAMGTLNHVNLSYFLGFKNFTTPSGRERAVPQYRPTAVHDDVTGYFAKAVLGSQRRRRTSTTY